MSDLRGFNDVCSLLREINKAGLPGLYEIILETAGTEIKHALEVRSGIAEAMYMLGVKAHRLEQNPQTATWQVIIECAETETPVLYFCKLGKVSCPS